ncbi:PREDICTED: uncharacterized protein LOC108975880 [Bactrocera latifrons]|uniref:Uncharacterized protein n=1 Tax=Bactrocera latifrons TaxID=174628 RepID=A0A0K8VC05_BACLA|nr:PREDICTED: uncharacterized protein LOC108975880 [Bactrocera latifrons]
MNGGPCPRCSELLRPCCRCGAIPSNLAFLRKVLNKPKRTRSCRHKRPRCVTLAAGGDSIDCLCCFDANLAARSDRRLQTWQRELQLRNNIADRLVQRTGKAYCELLFNRSGTVDGRDKSMTQRLLAHAESINPRVHQKKAAFTECSPDGCCTMELISTQPAKQRYFEVSGLPAGVKCELIGENCCVRRSGWVTSRAVQENIAAKVKDIRRVLPFFPDIEYLQIIGRQMTLYEKPEDFDEYACLEEVIEQQNIDEPCTNETCAINANIAMAVDSEDGEVVTDENVPEVDGAEQQQEVGENVMKSELDENIDEKMAALALDEKESSAISCSNSDIEFYRELLSNRAKCHDIFYRP